MIILGITMGINSSCCLMINGKVVAAEREERSKKSKTTVWPGNAIQSCLDNLKLKLAK